jgi:hypothetical protein
MVDNNVIIFILLFLLLLIVVYITISSRDYFCEMMNRIGLLNELTSKGSGKSDIITFEDAGYMGKNINNYLNRFLNKFSRNFCGRKSKLSFPMDLIEWEDKARSIIMILSRKNMSRKDKDMFSSFVLLYLTSLIRGFNIESSCFILVNKKDRKAIEYNYLNYMLKNSIAKSMTSYNDIKNNIISLFDISTLDKYEKLYTNIIEFLSLPKVPSVDYFQTDFNSRSVKKLCEII